MRGLITGDRLHRELSEADFERAGIRRRYRNVSLDAVPAGVPYVSRVREYCSAVLARMRDGVGLFLHGSYRGGKTSAACCVAIEAMKWRGTALFVRGFDVQRLMIDNPRWDEDETWVERMKTVNVLVIDDFETVGESKFAARATEHIIRERFDDMLPTVVTTNADVAQILEVMSPSFPGVLKEAFVSVNVAGIDWSERKRT